MTTAPEVEKDLVPENPGEWVLTLSPMGDIIFQVMDSARTVHTVTWPIQTAIQIKEALTKGIDAQIHKMPTYAGLTLIH